MVNHDHDLPPSVAWLQQRARQLDQQMDQARTYAETHDLLPPRWFRRTLRILAIAGLVLLAIVAYMVAVVVGTDWLTNLYQQAAGQ